MFDDYSIIPAALELGGVIVKCVDLQTGEILPLPGMPGGRVGGKPVGTRSEGYGGQASLSTAHIRINKDERPKIEYWPDGQLIKARRQGPLSMAGGGGGKRGRITAFTRGSRRRLMQRLGQVNRHKLGVFMTLTYPDNFPLNPTIWKSDLHKLLVFLKRHYPKLGGAWRMEVKMRLSGEMNAGQVAPHFHFILWGERAAELNFTVAQYWHKIAGAGDPYHLAWHLGLLGGKNKPCCQEMRSVRGTMSYAGKYCAKIQDESEYLQAFGGAGRLWGFHNAAVIPWAEMKQIFTSDAAVKDLIRLMQDYMKRTRKKVKIPGTWRPSFSIFSCDPSKWAKFYENGVPAGDPLANRLPGHYQRMGEIMKSKGNL